MSAAQSARSSPPASSGEVAALVSGTLEGPGDLPVRGIDALDRASAEQVTFAGDEAHCRRIEHSRARVVILSEGLDPGEAARGRAIIRVRSAESAIIALLEAFAPPPHRPEPGVHPMAAVHPTATIGENARIGAFVSVGEGARVGRGVTLHEGVRIGAGGDIGDGCELHANAVVHARCSLGQRVVLHAGVVVGGDGFGYRPSPDGRGLRRVPHLGIARLEDDVEIGACTCIDRAKFGETVVGAGTKIDNLCQVAHNVRIGRSCVIAALVGVAGSTTIGDGTKIGGQVGIADHLTIGRGVSIAATAAVMGDIPDGATWAGVPAQDARLALREAAVVRKLPEWSRRLRHLLEGERS
ncbi:MAG: UDP-3-O-(3-hydroxymyristoyl)glucosamine N-acyltransferase [Phycisphaeraceae bacterium]|nr:UDP-3-O-(3-hydroxymyristoyl)glucosamine N-acyltransferase [Phycisphaeraceae bacterium]